MSVRAIRHGDPGDLRLAVTVIPGPSAAKSNKKRTCTAPASMSRRGRIRSVLAAFPQQLTGERDSQLDLYCRPDVLVVLRFRPRTGRTARRPARPAAARRDGRSARV